MGRGHMPDVIVEGGGSNVDAALAVTQAVENARQEGQAEGVADGMQLAAIMELTATVRELGSRLDGVAGDVQWTRTNVETLTNRLTETENRLSSLTDSLTETEPETETETETEPDNVLEVEAPDPPQERQRRGFGGLIRRGNRRRR